MEFIKTLMNVFFSLQLLNSGNFINKRDASVETDRMLEVNEPSSSNCICNANVSVNG